MENEKKLTFLDRLDQALTENNRWLYVLFGVSILLKLAYLLQSADALHVQVPIMDSEYYDRMATGILSGRLIQEEAFFMGPLYPYFLATVYSVLGKNYMLVRLIAATKRPKCPQKPNPMDSEHSAMWNFMLHLDGRIDGIYRLVAVGLVGVVATLVAVLVK